MPRSVPWRRTVSDACCWHQSQALDATIYILRQTGPTGFLLKEEGETRTVKVFLGDPHTCTCTVYKKERDLCKHICWLLLRKFRLSVNDPLSWQLGLVDIEVNEILRGRVTSDQSRPRRTQVKTDSSETTIEGRTAVQQREIAEEDVCPICQDEFLVKKLPVTYCKFGCGNSVHIKCMQVWAEHQQKTTQDGSIKCPMCREDFGPINLLKTEMRNAGCPPAAPPGVRMDRHLGLACGHCSKAPIEGKCYRCTVCPTFHMCQRCFNLPVHTQHAFQFRHKRNQRWRSATRSLGANLPPALVNDLMHRDITENDYDMLLQMERNEEAELSNLSETDLQRIPVERVRDGLSLLAPGSQCRVCLRGFSVGQYVRKLPCKHKFHKDCIDNWLLHSHPTCPIDGLLALQPQQPSASSQRPERSDQETISTGTNTITVPGIGDLTIAAFGIPVATSRLAEESQARTAATRLRHAPISSAPVPLSMEQLELSGTALGGAGDREDESSPQSIGPSPGNSLVQQMTRQRNRISQQLAALHRENSSGSQRSQHVTARDLIQFLAMGGIEGEHYGGEEGLIESRRPSAGSVSSVVSGGSLRVRRGGHTRVRARHQIMNNDLRSRAGSLDRSSVPSIQNVHHASRDIYLGNDPILQPAMRENIAPQILDNVRTRPKQVFRSVFRSRGVNRAPAQPSRSIRLEGNAIEHRVEDIND